MSAFFRLVAAGPLFFVSAWLLMIFAGIVASDVGQHGSRSAVDSYNVAVYGSYQPGESAYVDALAAYHDAQARLDRLTTPAPTISGDDR